MKNPDMALLHAARKHTLASVNHAYYGLGEVRSHAEPKASSADGRPSLLELGVARYLLDESSTTSLEASAERSMATRTGGADDPSKRLGRVQTSLWRVEDFESYLGGGSDDPFGSSLISPVLHVLGT
jgi:hypothetical protein